MTADHAPRMLVASAQQQERLIGAATDVRLGVPRSAEVDAALDDLLPVKRQFDAEPHYLLAAAAHLCDEGVLDENYELADKLGIVIGDAAMVLRLVANTDRPGIVDEAALVSGFYPGAESDPHSRALLLRALEVMRAAIAGLRDGDVLIILAR